MNLWNYKAIWKLSANLTCFHEPHIWTERVLEDVLLLKCCSRDKQEFQLKLQSISLASLSPSLFENLELLYVYRRDVMSQPHAQISRKPTSTT